VTPRQLEVLRCIEEYTDRKGFSPTLQEIADRLRVSKVTVLGHLRQLEKGRHIRRGYYRRRGIQLLTRTRRIPVVGRIAAGRPIDAIAHPGDLDLLAVLKENREYFALEVRGDSMTGDGILDGDYVIAERRPVAEDGETVVALLEDGTATLKRFYREGNRVRLQPANPSVEPLVVDRVRIQGVVVGIFRKL